MTRGARAAIVAVSGAAVGLVAAARAARPALRDLDGPALRIERWVAGYGVRESAAAETRARCVALGQVIERRAGRYRVPRGGSARALLLYLDSREPPSRSGSALERRTADAVAAVRQGLRAAGLPLGPDELLERCVAAAGEDLPLGILACHNLLKEVTIEVRAAGPPAVADDAERVAARLRPWRRRPRTPGGETDKLGPLYHLFATLTAGVWGGTPWLGRLVEWGEAARRAASLGRDRPDPEKGEADRCGAHAAFLVWRLERPERSDRLRGIRRFFLDPAPHGALLGGEGAVGDDVGVQHRPSAGDPASGAEPPPVVRSGCPIGGRAKGGGARP